MLVSQHFEFTPPKENESLPLSAGKSGDGNIILAGNVEQAFYSASKDFNA